MSWNYRVVKHTDEDVEYFTVHEAFYHTAGCDEPSSITDEPIALYGDTLEELQADFEHQKEALSKPVLRYEDF